MGCDACNRRVWSYHRGCDVTPVIEIHHRVMSHPITPSRHTHQKANSLSFKFREFLLGKIRLMLSIGLKSIKSAQQLFD